MGFNDLSERPIQRLRFGQVGCNGVAHQHAAAHRWTGNTELVAVCDVEAEKARAFAIGYGARDVHANADELFARPDLDVVDLVTPDHTHAPLAIAAMRHGKHVLVEKPFATSLEEAGAMVAAAQQHGVRLMCIQSMRWLPKIRKLAESVQRGDVGEPVFVRSWGGSPRFWDADHWPRAASRGSKSYLLTHNAMHSMDLLCWLFNDRPINVYTQGHPGEPDVPLWEFFSVNVRFARGGIGLFEENRMVQPPGYPLPGTGIHVIGSMGTLYLDPTAGHAVSLYTRDGLHFPGSHAYVMPAEDSFVGLIREFADSIVRQQPPPVGLDHSRAVLAGVLAAVESFDSGRAVEVPYD